MSKTDAIAQEQEHFDTAWDARERARANLGVAHQSAAGNNKIVGEVKRAAEQALSRLGEEDEAVAFGRIDLEAETFYIGRHAITSDERDLLVLNWQVPAVAPYFTATIQDSQGVQKKRQFQTEMNEVRDFEDITFAEIAVAVDDLVERYNQPIDDALLRDLEVSRDGEMRDIVQTIHHSQYALISRPIDQLLSIQGGPGTGKTAVALHRVSWLLFQHRDTLSPQDFLVVGPSKTFTSYIKKVLPSLGDEGVAHGDLASLGPVRSDERFESADVVRLKGESRMSGLIRRGLSQRVRVPSGESFTLGTRSEAIVLSRDEIENAIASIKTSARTYRLGRDALRDWVSTTANDRLNHERNRVRGARLTVQPSVIESFVERFWPSLTATAFIQDLLGSQQRLVAAAGEDFSAAEILRLQRQPSTRISQETWSATDVALLDEAEARINGRPQQYAHIVIDEAQDLSPMQLRSIRRRSLTGSMTIVGDIAQSTSSWARDTWDDLLADLSRESVLNAHRSSNLATASPASTMSWRRDCCPARHPKSLRPSLSVRRQKRPGYTTLTCPAWSGLQSSARKLTRPAGTRSVSCAARRRVKRSETN